MRFRRNPLAGIPDVISTGGERVPVPDVVFRDIARPANMPPRAGRVPPNSIRGFPHIYRMEHTMSTLGTSIPSDYVTGYARAREIDPALADRYISYTTVGDPEADAVVAYLNSLPRAESVELTRQAMDFPDRSELLRQHPLVRDFIASLNDEPDWLDQEAFHAAYRMFHHNSRLVLAGMLGGVLVEGFSTNISKSFFITGRLRDSGVRRLRQNNRHMVEIFMPGGLERRGEGWKLSVRVRLIHARVRNLLLDCEDWDADAWGTPVSAAHLALAISAFSARLLRHMAALGASYSDEERESFMQVWRYSGYLMGIPEPVLFQNEQDALRMFEIGGICEPPPDLESIVMAHALVRAAARVVGIADPEQSRKLTSYVYRVSRSLIGGELADELKYPHTPTWGVLPWFRLQSRYERLIRTLWPNNQTHSYIAQFSDLFTASQYDDTGISYRLPDHPYSERSTWY